MHTYACTTLYVLACVYAYIHVRCKNVGPIVMLTYICVCGICMRDCMVHMYMFIHSFRPFLKRHFKSYTTQRRSRLQHGYCIGVSRRSAQATVGKGLAQGPYT